MRRSRSSLSLLGVFGVFVLLGIPAIARASPQKGPPANPIFPHPTSTSVTMTATVGWEGHFRRYPAWTPVHVQLANHSSTNLSGDLQAFVAAPSSEYLATPTGDALYRENVTLPALGSKRLTLYIRAPDPLSSPQVSFLVGRSTLASVQPVATGWEDNQISIGALSTDPANVSWLHALSTQSIKISVSDLTGATLDPFATVLNSFDIIVLSNYATQQLSPEQLWALDRFVRNGGALVEVAGDTWRDTLSPLPGDLQIGHIQGTEAMNSLPGLGTFTGLRAPQGQLSLPRLVPARGAILAAQGALPLLVRAPLGNGQITYLGPDPSLDPLRGWSGANAFLSRVILGSAPEAVRRLAVNESDRTTGFLNPLPGTLPLGVGLMALSSGSLPTPSLPLVLIYAVLIVLLVLIGWAATRWSRRVWGCLALLALVCDAVVILLVTPRGQERATMQTVGVVEVDGSGQVYPASWYVALTAPRNGNLDASFGGNVLPSSLLTSFEALPNSRASLATLTELPTQASFNGLHTGGARAVSLQGSISLPGNVNVRLSVARNGELVGRVQNGTSFPLLRPALVGGHRFERLPDLSPGASATVRLEPGVDPQLHVYPNLLNALYGTSYVGDFSEHRPSQPLNVFGLKPWVRPCCLIPGLPGADGSSERLGDAASMLAEGNLVPLLGDITFVAWTDRPLLKAPMDGRKPAQRSLTLLVKPLEPTFPRGPFTLRTGTITAHVSEVHAVPPQYNCCGQVVQPIPAGPGGSSVYQFSLPSAKQAHFNFLKLSIYAGGTDPSGSGYTGIPRHAAQVYDWRAGTWRPQAFKNGETTLRKAADFVSYTGALLIRLRTINSSGDMIIDNPAEDLQISGSGIGNPKS